MKFLLVFVTQIVPVLTSKINQSLRFLHQTSVQELESLAKEQDDETDKVALLKEVDNHRKQLER